MSLWAAQLSHVEAAGRPAAFAFPGVVAVAKAGRSDALRKKHRRIVAAAQPPCALCGRPIDYSIPWPDDMSFELDHRVAVANGGTDELWQKQAAHRVCNRKKSAKPYAEDVIRRSGALR